HADEILVNFPAAFIGDRLRLYINPFAESEILQPILNERLGIGGGAAEIPLEDDSDVREILPELPVDPECIVGTGGLFHINAHEIPELLGPLNDGANGIETAPPRELRS